MSLTFENMDRGVTPVWRRLQLQGLFLLSSGSLTRLKLANDFARRWPKLAAEDHRRSNSRRRLPPPPHLQKSRREKRRSGGGCRSRLMPRLRLSEQKRSAGDVMRLRACRMAIRSSVK
jgi:hypothetical protein